MYLNVFRVILIFYFSMGISKTSEVKCGVIPESKEIQSYIIGGHKAAYMQFPWLASFHYRGSHICGAVLISSEFVLTAAHCLVDDEGQRVPVEQFKVVIGMNNMEKMEPYRQDISVKKTFINKDFDFYEKKNDIGLAQLSKAIDFQRTKIRPICLPHKDDLFKDTGILAGWGIKNSSETCAAKDLLYITIPLTDSKTCIEELKALKHDKHLYTTTICSLHRHSGVDGCDGDSGGPFMCFDKKNDKTYACGIMSFGCFFCSGYGAYTKVSYFRDWIYNTMKNPGNDNYIPKKEKDDTYY